MTSPILSALQATTAKALAASPMCDGESLLNYLEAVLSTETPVSSLEQLTALCAPHFVNFELVDDEADAAPLVADLFARLEQLDLVTATSSPTSSGPRLLSEAITIDAGTSASASAASAAKDKRKRKKHKKKKKKKKKNSSTSSSSPTASSAPTREEREQRLAEVMADESAEFAEHAMVNIRGRSRTNWARDLQMEGVYISIAGHDLLAMARLNFMWGRRYGLVGANGIGKSVLLRRIASHRIAGFPEHLRAIHVRQEVPGSDSTVLEVTLSMNKYRQHLLSEEDRLLSAIADDSAPDYDPDALGRQLDEVYEDLHFIESDQAEGRARAMLKSLQFTDEMLDMPTRQLSGGWRMRVSLAGALLVQPELLLLDEPTTFLDLSGVIWLQQYLQTYEGVVVVVSHDRAFLDAVATDIVHFQALQLHYYPGDFESFVRARQNKAKKMQRIQSKIERDRAHYKATIDRIERACKGKRGDQKKLGTVASRRKKLTRMGMERTEDGKKHRFQKHGFRQGSWLEAGAAKSTRSLLLPEDPCPEFAFPEPPDLGSHAIGLQLEDVSFAYGPEHGNVLEHVTLPINRQTRIAVVGDNGQGKSTLLKLITGDLQPTAGRIQRHNQFRIGYFSQHHVNSLDLTMTPLEHLLSKIPDSKEMEMRKVLGRFGIKGDLALQPIQTLSGGQRTRVVCATITAELPQLLVLDEITTYLDMNSCEAVVEAINEFKGGVIIVSHDQSLISRVAQQIYLVQDRTVTRFEGDFDDYRKSVVAKLFPS